MVDEARLEPTEHGLVPKGEGWFVLDSEGREAGCVIEFGRIDGTQWVAK